MSRTSDALGATIQAGDEVAYVARRGSRVYIERRVIEKVLDSGNYVLLKPLTNSWSTGRSGKVAPYHLIALRSTKEIV